MNGRSENWQIATAWREECVCLCNAGREDLTRAQRRGRPTGSSYGRQCGYRSRTDRSPSFPHQEPPFSTGSRLTTHCSPLLARANKTSTNEFGTALNVPLPPRRREICVYGDLHSAEKCGDNMPTRQYLGPAKELF